MCIEVNRIAEDGKQAKAESLQRLPEGIHETLPGEEEMIVLSHGHFDLLHYGHFRHLQLASELGGVLVVSLTAGRFMTKPGHPIFTDAQRVEMLRALRYVDSALICDDAGPYRAIDQVNPDIYVKGLEYEGRLPEYDYCVARGIQVKFLGEKIFGSTRLKSLLPVT